MSRFLKPTSPSRAAGPLALLTVLSLTTVMGCAASPGSQEGAATTETSSSGPAGVFVYDFSGMMSAGSGEVLEVRLPATLLEGAQEADVMQIDFFEVSSYEVQSLEHCAADIRVHYRDQADMTWLTSVNDETTAMWAGPRTAEDSWASRVLGLGSPASEFWGYYGIDELNREDPAPGVYVAEDFTSAIVVNDCANEPGDITGSSGFGKLSFVANSDVESSDRNRASSSPANGWTFAKTPISVMANGGIYAPHKAWEIWGYEQDSSGTWIKD